MTAFLQGARLHFCDGDSVGPGCRSVLQGLKTWGGGSATDRGHLTPAWIVDVIVRGAGSRHRPPGHGWAFSVTWAKPLGRQHCGHKIHPLLTLPLLSALEGVTGIGGVPGTTQGTGV